MRHIYADVSLSANSFIGALAGLATVLGALFLLARLVRSVWRTIRRANETIDALQDVIKEWVGEKPNNGDPGRPSVPVRITNLERTLAAHVQHHPGAGTRRAPQS